MVNTPDDKQDNDSLREQKFSHDRRATVLNQLRKLQRHARLNVPAEIAQKSKSAFDLQQETQTYADQMNRMVSVVVYPQDPFVGEPEIREMLPQDIQPGLVNARVRIRDSQHQAAQPDEENNYYYWPGTPEFDQVNAFYYTTFTLRIFERYANRRIPWAFGSPRLNVDPHMGEGLNAFYDEQSRLLGFFNFEVDGEQIVTAQSADVVSHETAHAVLDGLRDLYNESFGLGPAAFHESFGDMTAVLVALHDDSLVARLLDWTGNDLRVGNFVTEVAEHLTDRLQNLPQDESAHRLGQIEGQTIYLRNALNMFKYRPFDDLSYLPENPEFELGRESHNYARLFTGAFYDLLVAIYEYHREMLMPPKVALHRARDVMGYLLICAIELGPVGEMTFADMARAFLTADVILYDGKHESQIITVFNQRRILDIGTMREHLKSLNNLPEIYLPPTVDSALEAGIFLVDDVIPLLGLPDDEFTPMSAHRTNKGHAYLTYFCVRPVDLNGPEFKQFDGSQVDVFGGLTLAFDPSGRLRSVVHRSVIDEDLRQIRLIIAELIENGLVMESAFGPESVTRKIGRATSAPERLPQLLYLPADPVAGLAAGNSAKLVRIPMILDEMPRLTLSLLEYLKGWRSRLE